MKLMNKEAADGRESIQSLLVRERKFSYFFHIPRIFRDISDLIICSKFRGKKLFKILIFLHHTSSLLHYICFLLMAV